MLKVPIDISSTTGADRTHSVRRKLILAAHPEVAKLFGTDIITFYITVFIVAAQFSLAYLLGHLGASYWWLTFLAAYLIGAFANHTLFVVIHDSIHNTVFKSPTLNKFNAILADLPNAFPTAMGFRCYHIKHHSHLSSYDFDADVPSEWESKLVSNVSWRKAVWLFFFALMQLLRVHRLKGTVPFFSKWNLINIAAVLVSNSLVFYFFGGMGVLYLFLSFWFSVGLHIVGARWIQEHYAAWPSQGTFNYAGPLNKFALNIGYHNEHHDFTEIPWRKLPELRNIAPEFYQDLQYHNSWSKLLVEFIFDKRYSLASRVENLKEGHPA